MRFDRRLCDRVSLEIHRNFLSDFVHKGDRVLDAGAGPGRFTIDLVRLGATVVVGDISPEQLRLNEEKVKEAAAEAAIESRELLDISDLSRFEDGVSMSSSASAARSATCSTVRQARSQRWRGC